MSDVGDVCGHPPRSCGVARAVRLVSCPRRPRRTTRGGGTRAPGTSGSRASARAGARELGLSETPAGWGRGCSTTPPSSSTGSPIRGSLRAPPQPKPSCASTWTPTSVRCCRSCTHRRSSCIEPATRWSRSRRAATLRRRSRVRGSSSWPATTGSPGSATPMPFSRDRGFRHGGRRPARAHGSAARHGALHRHRRLDRARRLARRRGMAAALDQARRRGAAGACPMRRPVHRLRRRRHAGDVRGARRRDPMCPCHHDRGRGNRSRTPGGCAYG